MDINVNVKITDEDRKMLQEGQAGTVSTPRDDCDYEDARAKSNRLLAQDMIDFEECINYLGIETRDDTTDQFRNWWGIIYDIITLTENNPTLLADIEGKRFQTSDEQFEFLKKYNFDGVMITDSLAKYLKYHK